MIGDVKARQRKQLQKMKEVSLESFQLTFKFRPRERPTQEEKDAELRRMEKEKRELGAKDKLNRRRRMTDSAIRYLLGSHINSFIAKKGLKNIRSDGLTEQEH